MFELLDQYQVNELHVRDDAASGLKAFIAIHNTDLGPALGGCRFISYEHETQAIQDVISLARGMSYKAALAGVPQGGGKSVIIKPKGAFDSHLLFSEFGRFVDSLNGRYITAIDSGTSAVEMDIIRSATPHVTSTSRAGNPSLYTAKGVYEGIKAAVRYRLGRDTLEGLTVAIQGVGNVGMLLGRMLDKAGAHVIVADVNQTQLTKAVANFASDYVSPDDIHKIPCAVFAPCGLSNVINDQSIDELGCMIVAGSANVQLLRPDLGQRLHDKGILYAPDYVINAGGLVYASLTHLEATQKPGELVSSHAELNELIYEKIEGIGSTLSRIFERSIKEGLPTSAIADQMAREILHLDKVVAA